ncbi:hypothetical protein HOG16_01075, partial [Candidatus Woesearchaeota archaeon]|nr:hypothetical protein [Candidatus Woesearchaeota archaeon]
MVYKKYISRGGKKFGPYYFKSVRTKGGKVKSIYLGTENPTKKNLSFFTLFLLVALLFVFGFLGMFVYQGFNVADVSESFQLEEPIKTDISEETVDENVEGSIEGVIWGITDEEESLPTEEKPVEELEITNEERINETEIFPELNETEVNETIPEINETEIIRPINTTNETNIDDNISFDLNVTESNTSLDLNNTLENVT